ncbi:MAG TPA: hypothetical protein VMU94_28680 [Streptosporangiaceae bacterium]|nr:hypothetical protein [Streptosporangiaceae bacterium]HVB42607.1 hypothetical protein [Streptosporangiaceae bacterium]
MRMISPARFLLTTTAAAGSVVLAAAMPAASASLAHAPAAWHVSLQVPGSSFPEFTAVTATSGSSAWAFAAVGSKAPVAYQLSGSSWKSHSFPAKAGDSVQAAASSSASNVWAFTFTGQVLRFNGSSWAAVKKFSKVINSGVVVSSTDVWVFGSPGPGTWHYNGHSWTHSTSGSGLNGGSALSASSIWAYGGTSVAHWNGSTWTKTSVASLLPKNTQLSHSFVGGIYAASASNVYAIGSGGRQDEGGPLVLLHYNGHAWSRVAENTSLGDPTAVIPDGSGGVWIPVRTAFPGDGSMEHYSHGALSSVRLPFSPPHLLLVAAAIGKHTTAAVAVGYTRKSFSAKTTTAVILRYGS